MLKCVECNLDVVVVVVESHKEPNQTQRVTGKQIFILECYQNQGLTEAGFSRRIEYIEIHPCVI